MNSKHFLLGLLTLAIIQSCKKEFQDLSSTQSADTTTTVSTQSRQPEVATSALQTFAMPVEVEGCSCYFAKSQEDYDNEQFVYVDDYGNNAYIKLEGKMIKIPMEEGDFDPSNFNKVIEDLDYKIIMTGRKTSEQDETMMFQGELSVYIKKEDRTITTPVYGECGC